MKRKRTNEYGEVLMNNADFMRCVGESFTKGMLKFIDRQHFIEHGRTARVDRIYSGKLLDAEVCDIERLYIYTLVPTWVMQMYYNRWYKRIQKKNRADPRLVSEEEWLEEDATSEDLQNFKQILAKGYLVFDGVPDRYFK